MNDQTDHDPNQPEKPSGGLPSRRMAFLLRLWCADDTGRADWQASLEMPDTGKRIGFANLEQLFLYLVDLSENHHNVQE